MSRLQLHVPLSPIQEDDNSTDEEDDHHTDHRPYVHFTVGAHHDFEDKITDTTSTPPTTTPCLRSPPKPDVYHNNHRYQKQANYRPLTNNRYYPHYTQREPFHQDYHHLHQPLNCPGEGDCAISEALVEYVQQKTEKMIEAEHLEAGQKEVQVHKPKHYLWFSVVCCLCCFPLGIVALWYSWNVSKSTKAGDLGSAKKYSKKALGFCILAVVCDIVVVVIIVVAKFGGVLFKDLKFSLE